jgi:hypothetical protein
MQMKTIPSINIIMLLMSEFILKYCLLIKNDKSKFVYWDCSGSIFKFLKYSLNDSLPLHLHHNSNNSLLQFALLVRRADNLTAIYELIV